MFKKWIDAIKASGFTKMLFVVIAIVLWMLGHSCLAQCALVIFIYINLNTILKKVMGLKKFW